MATLEEYARQYRKLEAEQRAIAETSKLGGVKAKALAAADAWRKLAEREEEMATRMANRPVDRRKTKRVKP
jgi:hypothetical protein